MTSSNSPQSTRAAPRPARRAAAGRREASLPPARRRAQEERREYPAHPRVGVGGVVIDHGRVLLIRRGRAPLKGRWSLPGGLVELGEELAGAIEREVLEETGLRVAPVEVIGVFERVLRDSPRSGRAARVRYHYVLIDYSCRLRPGSRPAKLRAGSDVSAARWVASDDLARYRLTRAARDVILAAFARRLAPAARQGGRGRPL